LGRHKKEIHPFEDASPVEAICRKTDAAHLLLASHSKKRPSTLTFCRLFDGSILDMVETHVVGARSIRELGSVPCGVGLKPAFAFLGELWDQKEDFRMLRNLLLDCYRGVEVEEADLGGLETFISCLAVQRPPGPDADPGEELVLLRVYRVSMNSRVDSRVPAVHLTEMGPRLDMRLGRTKAAHPDLMKEALRKVRDLEPRTKKNVSKTVLGDTFGRVHVGDQKLGTLQTRKLKGLKETTK